MTIYVQSRGKSQEHDYRWLEVRKDSQRPEIPQLLKNIKVEELIESQKPSLILARCGKYLLLLITALDSRAERTDFMGRRVRNSVAWVAIETPETEQLFRAIAVRALRDELAEDIDQGISIDGEYGFKVDLEVLQTLADRLEVGVSPTTSSRLKFGKNAGGLRSELALELSQFSLPDRSGGDQLLVVVTTLKSQAALEQLRVWRGLSSRIESETWVEVSPAMDGLPASQQKKTLFFGMLAVIVLLAIGLTLWFIVSNPSPQNLPPQRNSSIQPSSIAPSDKESTTQTSSAWFANN